ncbi:hypothetical protein KVR01_009402 [Diaporthe batatas]|uniref:uncharacterized protein n=1 Tax=Diaporthe batatas TaxID=748121 RepID=UPI001D05075F|nr:uncharacterized protein KVR01_009402 [Diaporthe batatas]KAG8161138.1 hypothetical protein KVR01_009402 [Diaporthe batatas]
MSSAHAASAASGFAITTPRLTIRTAVPPDGEALVAYFSNPANFPWPAEKDLTLEKILPRIDKWADATAAGRSAFMVIVVRETDQLIGFGGFNSLPRTEPLGGKPTWAIRKSEGEGEETVLVADIGVSIDHQHQRRGYAREASNDPMKALLAGLGVKGIEGDGSEPLPDAAFSFASKSINYDVDRAGWAGLRDELKRKGAWPL